MRGHRAAGGSSGSSTGGVAAARRHRRRDRGSRGAQGIPVDRITAYRFLRAVAAETRTHLPSSAVDVKNKHKTETESPARVRAPRRPGPPPNASIYAVIRIIEGGFGTRVDS